VIAKLGKQDTDFKDPSLFSKIWHRSNADEYWPTSAERDSNDSL